MSLKLSIFQQAFVFSFKLFNIKPESFLILFVAVIFNLMLHNGNDVSKSAKVEVVSPIVLGNVTDRSFNVRRLALNNRILIIVLISFLLGSTEKNSRSLC